MNNLKTVLLSAVIHTALFCEDFIYVANSGSGGVLSNTVSVIKAEDYEASTAITLGNGPTGIAMTPDGKYAYVTNAASNTVNIINTTDQSTEVFPLTQAPWNVVIINRQ